MIPDHITSQIETWITTVLDSPNSKFGNLPPCPYAKKAWVEGNVSVKMFDDVQSFTPQDWDKEVNIYVMNPWISSELLSEMAKNYNSMYSDYLFLEEHPDLIEDVGGFVVNQGKLILLIVQDRKPLEEARKKLQETNYYENWTPEMKKRIIER
tara:strand:+ start:266 stop:724 length:459 start_codon:yes stop_codon:yes gene_type:complete